MKGEGSFAIDGQFYPFRLAAGRPGEDGAVRVRLSLEPMDRPTDGRCRRPVRHRARYRRGSRAPCRSAVRSAVAAGGGIVAAVARDQPKHARQHLRPCFEQIEFQYGPDDRAIKLRGDANLTFGPQPNWSPAWPRPRSISTASWLCPSRCAGGRQMVIKSLAELFCRRSGTADSGQAWADRRERDACRCAISSGSAAKSRTDGETFDVELPTFRAPGATSVGCRGRLSASPKGLSFAGPRQDRGARSAGAARLVDRSRRRLPDHRRQRAADRGPGRFRQRDDRRRPAQG